MSKLKPFLQGRSRYRIDDRILMVASRAVCVEPVHYYEFSRAILTLKNFLRLLRVELVTYNKDLPGAQFESIRTNDKPLGLGGPIFGEDFPQDSHTYDRISSDPLSPGIFVRQLLSGSQNTFVAKTQGLDWQEIGTILYANITDDMTKYTFVRLGPRAWAVLNPEKTLLRFCTNEQNPSASHAMLDAYSVVHIFVVERKSRQNV